MVLQCSCDAWLIWRIGLLPFSPPTAKINPAPVEDSFLIIIIQII
jgi:hypothetical protein